MRRAARAWRGGGGGAAGDEGRLAVFNQNKLSVLSCFVLTEMKPRSARVHEALVPTLCSVCGCRPCTLALRKMTGLCDGFLTFCQVFEDFFTKIQNIE